MFLFGCRNANAGVRHNKRPVFIILTDLDVDLSAFFRVFDGIGEDVINYFIHLLAVKPYAKRVETDIVCQIDLLVLSFDIKERYLFLYVFPPAHWGLTMSRNAERSAFSKSSNWETHLKQFFSIFYGNIKRGFAFFS